MSYSAPSLPESRDFSSEIASKCARARMKASAKCAASARRQRTRGGDEKWRAARNNILRAYFCSTRPIARVCGVTRCRGCGRICLSSSKRQRIDNSPLLPVPIKSTGEEYRATGSSMTAARRLMLKYQELSRGCARCRARHRSEQAETTSSPSALMR